MRMKSSGQRLEGEPIPLRSATTSPTLGEEAITPKQPKKEKRGRSLQTAKKKGGKL